MPGTDDPDANDAVSGKVQLSLPIADEAFEAMLQDFDQDAMEAEPVPLDSPPPEEGLLEHDGREGGEEEPLGELLGEETTALGRRIHSPTRPQSRGYQSQASSHPLALQGRIQKRYGAVRINSHL